jgi:vancomycin resistance protein YoaR
MRDKPYEFTSDMKYDEGKVDEFIEGIRAEIDVAPVDAEVVLDVDAPRILTESSDGRKLDVEATKESLHSLLLAGTGETALKVDILKPAVSSDEVSGGLAVIASYKTDMTTSSSNRYKNVKLALSNFHAMAVYDGDIISFNDVVGERTAGRGYMQAPEYSGTSVITGYGGGSCQASTTLYCAAIMAGMDIIERHPHNMTVAYAEPSLDATVSWGNKDFIFQNNTGSTIYIYTKVTRKNAWVVIYGNRPEYKVDFQSVIVEQGIAPYKEEIREDVTGQYVYYTDEKYTYSAGKYGCTSQGWLVYYDWDTGEEIKRVQISQDSYSPGTSIVFVGVHERGLESTPEPATPFF